MTMLQILMIGYFAWTISGGVGYFLCRPFLPWWARGVVGIICLALGPLALLIALAVTRSERQIEHIGREIS